VVLSVALCYMLNQRTVIRQEVRCDVDCLGVPDLTIFETVTLRV